jgi:hypothetical protein
VRKGKRVDVYLEVRKRRGHIFFVSPQIITNNKAAIEIQVFASQSRKYMAG